MNRLNRSGHHSAARARLLAASASVALALPLLLTGPASAAPPAGKGHTNPGDRLARTLVRESSAADGMRHLRALQRIADASDGTRVAGSRGHERSAEYVEKTLKRAGYKVSRQSFDFVYTETVAETLDVVSPTPRSVPVILMTYTASGPEGGTTAPLAAVPADASDTTPGCEAADYASAAYTGKIALIKRGGCTFAAKQAAAADAGAVGAVVFNNTEGDLNGTIGDPQAGRIPTGGVTQAAGESLAAEAAAGEVEVRLDIREHREDRTTWNVIAETRGGAPARTVMLGAHLDSVSEGPGINDNGSGSAGLLTVAQELAKAHARPANKVRFAWWSAEEYGLLGSEAYVAALDDEQRERIALYLNFDMIASPNAAYFVYDGDDSDGVGSGPGPEGSAKLESDITGFLDARRVPHEGSDFTGRSDYGPFIEAGIPAGGTNTGAEGIKTEQQAARYGGTAGVAYDPCYHQACDDTGNIDRRAFEVNIDVIANAVGHYAYDVSGLA